MGQGSAAGVAEKTEVPAPRAGVVSFSSGSWVSEDIENWMIFNDCYAVGSLALPHMRHGYFLSFSHMFVIFTQHFWSKAACKKEV